MTESYTKGDSNLYKSKVENINAPFKILCLKKITNVQMYLFNCKWWSINGFLKFSFIKPCTDCFTQSIELTTTERSWSLNTFFGMPLSVSLLCLQFMVLKAGRFWISFPSDSMLFLINERCSWISKCFVTNNKYLQPF